MKNKFQYVELSKIEKQIVALCYRRILKHIASVKPNADLATPKEYIWFIQNGEIKPANISSFLLTPYWNEISDMLETKILIRILKKHS